MARPGTGRRTTGGLAAGLASFLLAASLSSAAAQEPEPPAADTIRADTTRDAAAPPGERPQEPPARQRCTLVLEPTPATRSESYRQDGEAYITHIWGGMRWTCGNAVMQADSAARYELERRVEMVGSVRYRDTVRSLTSDRLAYDEARDLVVATGDVRVTQLASGSTLEGPRVEFLRAVSRVAERTIATDRPHMVLYADSLRTRPPFEVDADSVELIGEETARAWGDVRIRRPDVTARADSAVLDMAGDAGVLYGSPRAEGQGFQLAGDTLRLEFHEGELREVLSLGRAEAAGEAYDVRSEALRIRVEGERAEEVWAFGPGRSVTRAPPYRLFGDSLRFALTAGQVDTVVAIGDAAAVEIARERPADEGAQPDTVAAPPDSAATPPDSAVAPADSAATPPDGAVAPADSVGVAPRDTFAAQADTAAGRGRAARPPPADTLPPDTAGPPPTDPVPDAGEEAPRLSIGEDANWMTGDTLYAIFEPAPPDEPGGAETTPGQAEREPENAQEAEEATEEAGEAGRAREEAGDTGEEGEADAGEPPMAEESSSRRLARIRVIGTEGSARAFYTMVRDSARTTRSSRNYLIGRVIDVFFREGRVQRVTGQDAIGIYLDPEEATAEQGGVPP